MKLYTAIIFTDPPQYNGSQFLKYRNVNNLEKFKKFAAKFPGARYINFYEKETKKFFKREKI